MFRNLKTYKCMGLSVVEIKHTIFSSNIQVMMNTTLYQMRWGWGGWTTKSKAASNQKHHYQIRS